MKFDYHSLRNGSDIRGYAVESDEAPVNLTDEVTQKVASAFVLWLAKKHDKNPCQLKVGIGRDSRISGERLRDDFVASFKDAGVYTYDCGLATTPSMFMLCVDEKYGVDGTVMLTASHLPYNRNGFKFFTKDGGLEGSDIKDILEIASYGASSQSSKRGRVKKIDYIKEYANLIKDKITTATGEKKPFKGMKIVVDAGNGAGGFYASKVLKPLGADICGSQFLEPDGTFPNHIPNPEDKEAMASISNATLDSKADLGIIFDTDVDRAAIVDASGKEINKEKLIALISAVLLKDKKGTIVTDSVTSGELEDFIAAHGGRQHRFKRGYKNVINEAIRLNNEGEYTPLAIETSGHAALMENYFLDDGAYLVTRLLIEAVKQRKENKTLSDLIADLNDLPFKKSCRFKIESEDFKDYGNDILSAFEKFAEESSFLTLVKGGYEGIRCSFGEKGWLLMRLSLHDPIIPFDCEAETKEDMVSALTEIDKFLKAYDRLAGVNTLLDI